MIVKRMKESKNRADQSFSHDIVFKIMPKRGNKVAHAKSKMFHRYHFAYDNKTVRFGIPKKHYAVLMMQRVGWDSKTN